MEQSGDKENTQPLKPELEKSVTAEVRKQLVQFSLAFGAVNIIAVILFWFAAVNVAKDQLVSAARNDVPFKNLLDEYTELARKEGANNSELETLKTHLTQDEALEEQLSKITPNGTRLILDAIAKLGNADFQRLLADLLEAQSHAPVNFFDANNLPANIIEGFRPKDGEAKQSEYDRYRDKEGSFTVDCSAWGIPKTAHGALVRVLLLGDPTSNDSSACFLATDSHGTFPNSVVPAKLANYTRSWIQGVVFCPFFDGQTFRFKLCNEKSTDPALGIGAHVTVVGWY